MSDMEIKEIFPDEKNPVKFTYTYETDSYYHITSSKNDKGWSFELTLKKLDSLEKKSSESQLFNDFVELPRAFVALVDGENGGYLQLGHDSWNNRLRIWELLVDEKFRGSGIGSQLMEKVLEEAKKLKVRMIVLETQSCNVPAINFYKKCGYDLIGFDSFHYSNDDVKKKEIRVEFGIQLNH